MSKSGVFAIAAFVTIVLSAGCAASRAPRHASDWVATTVAPAADSERLRATREYSIVDVRACGDEPDVLYIDLRCAGSPTALQSDHEYFLLRVKNVSRDPAFRIVDEYGGQVVLKSWLRTNGESWPWRTQYPGPVNAAVQISSSDPWEESIQTLAFYVAEIVPGRFHAEWTEGFRASEPRIVLRDLPGPLAEPESP